VLPYSAYFRLKPDTWQSNTADQRERLLLLVVPFRALTAQVTVAIVEFVGEHLHLLLPQVPPSTAKIDSTRFKLPQLASNTALQQLFGGTVLMGFLQVPGSRELPESLYENIRQAGQDSALYQRYISFIQNEFVPPLLKLEGVILEHVALFRYPSRELMHSWYPEMGFDKGANLSAPIMMVLNYISAWRELLVRWSANADAAPLHPWPLFPAIMYKLGNYWADEEQKEYQKLIDSEQSLDENWSSRIVNKKEELDTLFTTST
jgi:hypothetical protein